MEGDDHREAYTAIMWGLGVSHENVNIAGAETVAIVEGNMCAAAMQGCVALPGSRATPRMNRTRRNLGDLVSGRATITAPVRIGKARSRSR